MSTLQTIKSPLVWFLIGVLLLGMVAVSPQGSVLAEGPEENLLSNAGFEQVEGQLAVGWDSNAWGTGVSASENAALSGDWGIEIRNGNYWIRKTVPIVGGKPYEVSAWVLSDLGANGSLEIKLEFYRDTTNLAGSQGEHRSERYGSYSEWTNIKTFAEAPPEANLVTVLYRLYGAGTVYYDDVSLREIEYIPGVNILADRLFYYEDAIEGKVTGTIGPEDGILEGKTIGVSIYPESGGDPVVSEEIQAARYLEYTFDPRHMNLREPYILEVSLKTEHGETMLTDHEKIYRWERPTALREDGTLIVDGEPFFPVIGYHVLIEDYGKVNDTINTVQGMRRKAGNEAIQHHLDEAHRHGIKVLMPLYPAVGEELYGPEGIPYVREVVSNFKDHPAVIGWMIRDEPDIRGHAVEELAEVYREIRTIDSVHPAYMVIAGGSAYESYFRATDIAATDIYPMPNGPITRVGSGINNAVSMFPERPVYSILQTFQTAGYPYLPNITEVRHMAYQSILEGAKAIGYYSYTDPNWDIQRSTLYPGLIEFMENDLSYISEFILDGEHIASYKDEQVQWGLWEQEGQLYAMVLNLTEEAQSATITLPEHEGYQVERLSSPYSEASRFSNEINFDLSALESLLVAITPLTTSAEIKSMIEHFDHEGQFSNPGIARALSVHMTAIEHFEQQGDTEKLLKHMSGLQHLLSQHYASGLIMEGAYAVLADIADSYTDHQVKSWAHVDVKLEESMVVAGESANVHIKVENRGGVPIQDATVTVNWPDALGLGSDEIVISELNGGQTESFVLQGYVQEGISIGEYPIVVELAFEHDGQMLGYASEHHVRVAQLVEADFRVASQRIRATEPGQHDVALTLTNHASEPIEVTWQDEVSGNIWFDFGESVQVPARETIELAGVVHVGEGLSEDEYHAVLHAMVNGVSIDTASIAINYTKNLIKNPGFEETGEDMVPEGWSVRAEQWAQDEVYSGQYALTLLPDSENSWNVMSSRLAEIIPVTPGATYRLSGWVKIGAPDESVSFGIRQLDEDHGTVEYTWNIVSSDHTEWSHYEMEFIPAENTKWMQPFFYMGRNNQAQAWFDDIRLENITDELPSYSASMETTSIHASAAGSYPFRFTLENLTAEPIEISLEGLSSESLLIQLDSLVSLDAYQQVSVQGNVVLEEALAEGDHVVTIRTSVYGEEETGHELSLPIVYSRNLLPNPGFEEGSGSEPTSWQLRAGAWTTDEVHSGQHSISLIPDSENSWNVINSRGSIPLIQGKTYRLSGWIKLGAEDETINMGLRQMDANNATVGYIWEIVQGPAEWAHYEMEFVPSEETRAMQVFFLMGRINNENQVWMDDFRLEIVE